MSIISVHRTKIACSLSIILLGYIGCMESTYAIGVTKEIDLGIQFYGSPTLVGTKLYQPLFFANQVAVINTNTDEVIKNIDVGTYPYASSTLEGTKLYQPNSTSSTISVIDTISDTVIDTIDLDGGIPNNSPIIIGTKLYQPVVGTHQIITVDLSAGNTTGSIDIGEDPVTDPVVVGNKIYQKLWGGGIAVVNTTTDTLTTTIPFDDGGDEYGKPMLIGDMLYATISTQNRVAIIDTNSDQEINSITVGGYPIYGTNSGNLLYIPNRGASSISIIDTLTNQVIDTISDVGVTLEKGGIIINNLLYQQSGNGIIILDINRKAVVLSFNLGWRQISQPILVGAKLYQQIGLSNHISIIDTNNGAPTVTINGSGSLILQQGDTYTELGASWSDDIDGTGSDLTGSIGALGSFMISGSVDTNNLGDYTITYIKTDSSGLTGSTTRMISVIPRDITIPVVTLSGSSHMYVNQDTELVPNTASGLMETLIPHTNLTDEVFQTGGKSTFYPIEENRSEIHYILPFDFYYAGTKYLSGTEIVIYPENGIICMTWCRGEGFSGPYFGTWIRSITLAEQGVDFAGADEGIYILEKSGSILFRWKVVGSFFNQETGYTESYPLNYEVILSKNSSIQMNYGKILGQTWVGIGYNDDLLGPIYTNSQHQNTDGYNETASSLWSYPMIPPKYNDPGASWSDDRDGTGEILTGTLLGSGSFTLSGSVDLMTPGDYHITYIKVDTNGNIGQATRIVTVVGKNTSTPVVANPPSVGPGGGGGTSSSLAATLPIIPKASEQVYSGNTTVPTWSGSLSSAPNKKYTKTPTTKKNPVVSGTLNSLILDSQSLIQKGEINSPQMTNSGGFMMPTIHTADVSKSGSLSLFKIPEPKTTTICPVVEKVFNEESLMAEDIPSGSLGDAIKGILMFRSYNESHGGKKGFISYADQGTANNQEKFAPGERITRAEFIKLLVRSLACQYQFEGVHSGFGDVPDNDWSAEYITYAVNHGWINGYGNTIFLPHTPITRAEASKILANAIGIKVQESNSYTQKTFRDVAENNEFLPYIEELNTLGILGNGKVYFRPQQFLSRGETALLIYRTFLGGK